MAAGHPQHRQVSVFPCAAAGHDDPSRETVLFPFNGQILIKSRHDFIFISQKRKNFFCRRILRQPESFLHGRVQVKDPDRSVCVTAEKSCCRRILFIPPLKFGCFLLEHDVLFHGIRSRKRMFPAVFILSGDLQQKNNKKGCRNSAGIQPESSTGILRIIRNFHQAP